MGILHQKGTDFNNVFSAVVVPQTLIKYLLHASHDWLGHVEATKLYHFLKWLYYFKGMRQKLHEYVRSCHKCQIMNLQKTKFIHPHQDITQTQKDHLSIDLSGPYNTTSWGNVYVLMEICNLTGYLMIILIRNRKTMSAVNHSLADIMLKWAFPQNTIFRQWGGIQIQTYGKPLTTTRYNKNFHSPSSPTSEWKTRILPQIY